MGNGYLWAGMGDTSPRDEPPLTSVETGLAPSAMQHPSAAVGSRRGKPCLYERLGAISKSYENRLRLEPNAPCFLHSMLDFILQPDYIARLSVSPVDQCQGMFVRDASRSQRISLGEARMLHQPRRRNFVLRIKRGVAGNLKSFRRGAGGQIFELPFAEHGILEE